MTRDSAWLGFGLYAAVPATMVLLLAACSTPSEPKVRTVTVSVPVRQACVPADTAQPKAYPDAQLPTGAEAVAERFQFIAAANEARKARLAILEPIIAACR